MSPSSDRGKCLVLSDGPSSRRWRPRSRIRSTIASREDRYDVLRETQVAKPAQAKTSIASIDGLAPAATSNVTVVSWCEWEEFDHDRESGRYSLYGRRETTDLVSSESSAEPVGFWLLERAKDSNGAFEIEALTLSEGLETAFVTIDR
jgi:hypothetical protein